jgi:hypothetical protein
LIRLFKWAAIWDSGTPPSAEVIAGQVCAVNQWDKTQAATIIGLECVDLVNVAEFRNKQALLMMQAALEVVRKVAVGISSRFKWARINPQPEFI